MDWDDFPVILGYGPCHDTEDKRPEHNPIGFRKPK